MPVAYPIKYIRVKAQITPQEITIEKKVLEGEKEPELISFFASGSVGQGFIKIEQAEYLLSEVWEPEFTHELLHTGGYF